MKRLLIIGAMADVVEISRAAKACGIFVINFRNGFFAVPNPYADEVREVDLFDRESVLAAAKGLRLDGILANADLYMPVAVAVGRELGLTVNSPVAVDTMRSKFLFREALAGCGCFVPRYVRIDAPEELPLKLQSLSYPVIMKPICGNGSFGARRFDGFDQEAMAENFRRCRDFPGCASVVVEELVDYQPPAALEGDVFLHRGKFVWGGVFASRRSRRFPILAMSESAPAVLAEGAVERFRATAEKVLTAIGATFGEFDVEAFLTRTGEIFIVEINPRQPGCRLPWMSWKHSGIDMCRLLVTAAVGDERYFDEICGGSPSCRPVLSCSLYPDSAGTFVDVVERSGFPGRKIRRNRKAFPGDRVSEPKSVLGFVERDYYEFDSVEDMLKVRDCIEDWIRPTVIPRRRHHRLFWYRWLQRRMGK